MEYLLLAVKGLHGVTSNLHRCQTFHQYNNAAFTRCTVARHTWVTDSTKLALAEVVIEDLWTRGCFQFNWKLSQSVFCCSMTQLPEETASTRSLGCFVTAEEELPWDAYFVPFPRWSPYETCRSKMAPDSCPQNRSAKMQQCCHCWPEAELQPSCRRKQSSCPQRRR